MGQKVNPIGLRLGINRNWESRWFPKFETMPANVAEDDKIRKYVKKELYYAGIAQTMGWGLSHVPEESGAMIEAPADKSAVLTSKRFFRLW